MDASSPSGAPGSGRRIKLGGLRQWYWPFLLAILASLFAYVQAPAPIGPKQNWLDWLRYPVETNARSRLLKINRDLNAVAFAPDGQHVIAVGSGGAVLTSANGGTSWTSQTVGADDLNSVAIAPDGQHAIAVGVKGTVLISADDGANWTSQTVGPNYLTSVAIAPDGQHAIAVGSFGTILTSANGGASWTSQTVGSDALTSVAIAPDGQHAIAVGSFGTVLTSANGGASWTSKTVGSDHLQSVAIAPDGQHAIAVGYKGTVLTSANGGASWTSQTVGSNYLTSVAIAPDGQHAIAVGSFGTILTSANGGASWTSQTVTLSRLTSVAIAPDGQHAIAVGYKGTVLTSANGGADWTSLTDGLAPNYSVAIAPDEQHAIAVGDNGTVLTSANGGASWTSQTVGSDALTSVAIAPDGQHAIAVGSFGTVLTSANGGASWTSKTVGSDHLQSVAIAPDGQHAIAVGYKGTVLTSANGGASWTSQTVGSNYLTSVAIAPDGQHAIAVGYKGTVLTSANGGASWTSQTVTLSRLTSVAIAPDGQHAIAVGENGTLLTSANCGADWQVIKNPAPHAQYPAPWLYIALLACGLWLWWAMQPPPPKVDEGAAGMALSDAPAATFHDDRLNFTPLARGISRFLRHEKTSPPLTLAITGEWGHGKSTLMKLICEDLQRCHWRPVWFNVWHHQTEEQMLPALLDAIKQQGLPPWFSLDGWKFRAKLLWIRSKTHAFLSFLLLAVACFGAAYYYSHGIAETQKALDAIAKWAWSKPSQGAPPVTFFAFLGTLDPKAISISSILGIFPLITAAVKQLQAFGLDPAVLKAGVMERVTLKTLSAQNSFRTRFAHEFGDVTEALPCPIVIVIDDLDRCQPPALAQIIEAVNFLTSSGQCYVLLGMDEKRVNSALGLSFKDIAEEWAAQQKVAGSDELTPSQARAEYADKYLEKLINIEVSVPKASENAIHLLNAPELGERQRKIAAWDKWFKTSLIPGLTMIVAVSLLALSAYAGLDNDKRLPQPTPTETNTPPPAQPTPTPTPTASANVKPKEPERQAPTGDVLTPGELHDKSYLWPVGATMLALMLLLLLALRRADAVQEVVNDSKAFNDAQSIWVPFIAAHNRSPRDIKRFGNRVRYLCMLQTAEKIDDRMLAAQLYDRYQNALSWLAKRRGKQVQKAFEPSVATQELALREHRVVALAALHDVNGGNWRATAKRTISDYNWIEGSENIKKAIQAYCDATGENWPASDEALDAFQRTLEGIRISGDARREEGGQPLTPPSEDSAEPSDESGSEPFNKWDSETKGPNYA